MHILLYNFLVSEFTCKDIFPNSFVRDHNDLILTNINSVDLCWELCVASSGMTCLSVEYIFLESNALYKQCTLAGVDTSHPDYCNCSHDLAKHVYQGCS